MSAQSGRDEESVAEEARQKLQATGYRPIACLECRFAAGTLTISGVLQSYYHKQVAQAAVKSIEGVDRFVNNIKVNRTRR